MLPDELHEYLTELKPDYEESEEKLNKDRERGINSVKKISNLSLFRQRTISYDNWSLASRIIERIQPWHVWGWSIVDSASYVDNSTSSKPYYVTFQFPVTKTKWQLHFLDKIDNRYRIYINDYNFHIKESDRYDNNRPLDPKQHVDDITFDLSDFLDPGENKISVELVDYGGPSFLKYQIFRDGVLLHEVETNKKGVIDHIIKF